jgi:predicted alpha-1,2-mannosidase
MTSSSTSPQFFQKQTFTKEMKRYSFLLNLLFAVTFFTSCDDPEVRYTDMVNPFVGTDAHGHTFPGAVVPFGMIQMSPATRLEGWDGCSGYHYSDDTLYGFVHTALSGTGVSDYGDVLLMPYTGNPCLDNGTLPDDPCSYASPFSKERETARPGYYSVFLDKPQVQAELTASCRSGMHRYTWEQGGEAGFIIDLVHRDPLISSSLNILDPTTITGHRISSEWANEQHLYFAIRVSKPFVKYNIGHTHAGDTALPWHNHADSAGLKGWFGFEMADGEALLIRIGISAVDIEGAMRNLEAETPHFDFDKIQQASDDTWNRELGKIEVKGGREKDRRTFYTALYHTMIAPNMWSDVDGRYRGMDMQIHQGDTASPQYTIFSLWDTYRTLHPLLTIIDQKRTNDFINTFLRQYQQGGRLPVWELAANETDCMIGYHSVSVIADAFMKGIRGYDTQRALEAMLHSANTNLSGLDAYRKHGYIPADMESESVSKTLEYAYDDWCIAMMANGMGYDSIYSAFIQRAQYYKNIYDPETHFFRPKINSTFVEPFDPREVNFHLTEANTWQYNFYVPHDIRGHISLMGGNEQYEAMLDKMFSTDSDMTGRVQSDITGLIGQYAHGNEPSHHMAYLYAYIGRQHKTAELVRRIMLELYSDRPDGLCGNEDCGQMSAWYVMSAMGFYPVAPGSNQYVIGSPLFDEVRIHLENGNEFLIRARNNRHDAPYIRKATFNDEPFDRAYITHNEIMQGGALRFLMSRRPDHSFATAQEAWPLSEITEHLITPVPYIRSGAQVFFDEQQIRLAHPDPEAVISWSTEPETEHGDPLSQLGMRINGNLRIRAVAHIPGRGESHPMVAEFFKIPENRSITLHTGYAPQYSAGGDHALIDYLRGGVDFRTGRWQGYHQVDLNAVVELEQETVIRKISIGFLQDQNSWIFMPAAVEFQISLDGQRFITVGREENTLTDRTNKPVLHDFSTPHFRQKARFVRVIATNRGVCPPWHPGAGDKAWIFADEIVIE